MTSSPPPARQGKSVLGMVFLIAFIDLMGFSVIFPLLPEMLRHYLALEGPDSLIGRLNASLVEWANSSTSSKLAVATLFGGILGSLYSLLQFLFAPIWGMVSDRIGRRPTLLVTLAGTAASYLLWLFAGTFTVLIAARLLGGMMAGNLATASAVVGDTTSGKDRAKGMGIIGMAVGLGFTFGPAIGGITSLFVLPGAASAVATGVANPSAFALNPFSMPALAALVLSVVNLLWVAARFPETLTPERRGAGAHRNRLTPFRTLSRLHIPGVPLTSWVYFLYLIAFSGMEFTLTFLAVERFDYTPSQNAWMFVTVGLVLAAVQGGIVRRLAPKLGEQRLSLVGMLITVPGLLALGWAGNTGMLYAGLVLLAVGSGLLMPSLSALVSRYTPADRQGLALGAFRSAGALSRALGPILGGLLYWKLGSELPYLLAAGFLFLPALLCLILPAIPAEPGSPAET